MFLKKDSDKPRPELIPLGFVMEMARVMAAGAKKYAAGNWQKCDDITRYYGAAMRHLHDSIDGKELDEETGLSPLAHAACCCAILWSLKLMDEVRLQRRRPADPALPSASRKVITAGYCECEKPAMLGDQCAYCGKERDPLQLSDGGAP